MNKLKYLFPLSFLYKTPNKFFIGLLSYIGIYIIGGIIPLSAVRLASTFYVFIGAGILMANYLVKNKDDKNGEE